MASKDEQLKQARIKAISDLLISEVRSDNCSIGALSTMIENGADVTYSHSKCLYFAAKLFKFDIMEFLIKAGALADKAAAVYIAQLCEYKGFNDNHAENYFKIINMAVDNGFDRVAMLTPYINGMAVSGQLEKLIALMKKFYLTEAEIANSVYIRIIFEIILNAHDDVLDFINKHVDWIDHAAFDLAVGSGDWLALEYMLRYKHFTPSDKAIEQAIYAGNIEVLDILVNRGYKFNGNPSFLKKACRAFFADNQRSLEFLLKCGYTLSDRYSAKSIKENAEIDKNERLLEFLSKRNI